MSWRLAAGLVQLRGEVDARWPTRDKRSDGSIGDAAHRRSKSDHNPNDRGVVRAIDVDVDGIRADWFAEHLRRLGASGDRRLLNGGYVILNRRIASEIGGWGWRAYNGTNPHTSHVHVSVSRDPAGYDMSGGWGLTTATGDARPAAGVAALPRHPRGARVLRVTEPRMRGTDVQDVQRWVGVNADGFYGPQTAAAVARWQSRVGLDPSGVVGPATWASMRARPIGQPPVSVHEAPPPAPRVPSVSPSVFDLRFDVVWFDAKRPMSEDVFARLCAGQSAPGRGHYIAMPTTMRRKQVEDAGNAVAHYDNASLSGATQGAAGQGAWLTPGHLDRVVERILEHRAREGFTTPWIFLNEISASVWGRTPGYRRWVVALAERLAAAGLRPVVFAPFKFPTRPVEEWRQLGRAGFIGIEGYLDSARVASVAPEQRAAFCRSEYAKMLRAYEAQGVPASRLFLTEHFAQTRRGQPGGPRGRWGIQAEHWASVIRARSEGAAALPFGGHVTYAWMYNQMGEQDLSRFADEYVRSVARTGLGVTVAAPLGLGTVPRRRVPAAVRTAAMRDDATLVRIMTEFGIVEPQKTLTIAREVGLGLAIACAMLEMESSGGKNVFGRDRGERPNPVRSPAGRLLEVTKERYDQYVAFLAQGFSPNGVGPCQLTYPPLQRRADARGGAWRTEANLYVGFEYLRDLVRRNGLRLGAAMYNGGPNAMRKPAAVAYGQELARRVVAWRERLGFPPVDTSVHRETGNGRFVAETRTFEVTSTRMRGADVERWQLALKRYLDSWQFDYPLAIDGYYGPITRDATATVLYGLGIDEVAMERGVAPELRAKVRDKKLTPAELVRQAARRAWRAEMRKKRAHAKNVAPPLLRIITSSHGWKPGHDGVDLICEPDVPIFAICEAKVIDVRSSGWWGKGAPPDPSKGDGIIQLQCLVDSGPFRRGLHFGYGHAEKAIVRVGQHVKPGQQIGRAGFANAWHVHFMVNRGDTRRGVGDHDPMPYVHFATKT